MREGGGTFVSLLFAQSFTIFRPLVVAAGDDDDDDGGGRSLFCPGVHIVPIFGHGTYART